MRLSAQDGLDLEPRLGIVCIPSTDAELCAEVQRLYSSIRSVTPGRLQDSLREVYPQVIVRRVEIPDEPMPVWLVYRDGYDGVDQATQVI
jgi:hypothetical protein